MAAGTVGVMPLASCPAFDNAAFSSALGVLMSDNDGSQTPSAPGHFLVKAARQRLAKLRRTPDLFLTQSRLAPLRALGSVLYPASIQKLRADLKKSKKRF